MEDAIVNVVYKRTDCLSNIPQRDNKVAHPKAAIGVPHGERVSNAAVIGLIRYGHTVKELAKV